MEGSKFRESVSELIESRTIDSETKVFEFDQVSEGWREIGEAEGSSSEEGAPSAAGDSQGFERRRKERDE